MDYDMDGPRPAVHDIRPDAGASALVELQAMLFGSTRPAPGSTVTTTTLDYVDRKPG